jgi:hypothetical protein
VTAKLRKWKFLRVPAQTHKLLQQAKARAGIPMSELVHRLITFLYSGAPMQALTFFLLYLNDEATFVVASKDAETAETGFRSQMLGHAKPGTTVKAVPITAAPQEDVLRIGVAAIMTQLTQTNALLQTLLGGLGPRRNDH